MSLRSFTDAELMHEVEVVTDRAKIRALAREIIRLREALREIQQAERVRAEASLGRRPGASTLEISARALGLRE